jgi:hypothetical protein
MAFVSASEGKLPDNEIAISISPTIALASALPL